MKTKCLTLHRDWIRTDSLRVGWRKNGQIWRYEGSKDGRLHGESKWWDSDGQMWRHTIYENGKAVKATI